MVVAPASTAMRTISTRKSRSERVASSGENSTSSQSDRARRTLSPHCSSASARLIFNLYSRCRSLDARNTWMRARSANCSARAAISMSSVFARASDAMRGLRMACVIVAMAAKSPSEAMAKPASMMSTPRSSRAWAMVSFSCVVMLQPGDCSPSRRVVSKKTTGSQLMGIPALCLPGKTSLVQFFHCPLPALYKAKL